MGADLVGRSDRGRRGGPRGEVALDGAGDFEEEEEADGDKVLEEDREGGEGGHAPHPGVRDQGPASQRLGGPSRSEIEEDLIFYQEGVST